MFVVEVIEMLEAIVTLEVTFSCSISISKISRSFSYNSISTSNIIALNICWCPFSPTVVRKWLAFSYASSISWWCVATSSCNRLRGKWKSLVVSYRKIFLHIPWVLLSRYFNVLICNLSRVMHLRRVVLITDD